MTSPLFLGIDAGGTKSVACARAAGGATWRATGPAAQARRDGAAATAATLATLITDLRGSTGDTSLAGVVVGVAGAGDPAVATAVAEALRPAVGDAPLDVVSDAEIALDAAWADESGAMLIVGTGSVTCARTLEGAMLRAGGWGPALGDDGSGASLGRAALRAALAAWDGGPPTALADHLAEMHGLDDAAAVVAAAHAPDTSLARFAPVLLRAAEADDWVATATLARETNSLAQQVGWLATLAGETVAPRLALAGGLASESVYATALRAALERHVPGWTVAPGTVEPVTGALARAQRLAAVAA